MHIMEDENSTTKFKGRVHQILSFWHVAAQNVHSKDLEGLLILNLQVMTTFMYTYCTDCKMFYAISIHFVPLK